jgi:hypothetical protein
MGKSDNFSSATGHIILGDRFTVPVLGKGRQSAGHLEDVGDELPAHMFGSK